MARMRKRMTRWYDVMATGINVASSAGGVANTAIQQLVSETQIETEMQGRATLLTIVGDIYAARTVGTAGVLVMKLEIQDADINVLPADLRIAEDYEKPGVLWTKMWSDQGLTSTPGHIPVEVHSKRVVGQNQRVALMMNNTDLGAGTQNINVDYHLRLLFLLS